MSLFRRSKKPGERNEITQLAINACNHGHVDEFIDLTLSNSWLTTVSDDNGDNLLHHAARNGARFICALLLSEYSMSQLTKNKAGKIPLASCEDSKLSDMCTILLPLNQGPRARTKSKSRRLQKLLSPRSSSGDEVSIPIKRKLRNIGKPNLSKYVKSKDPPTATIKSAIKNALRRMGVPLEQHKVCECFQPQEVRKGEVIMEQGSEPAFAYYTHNCAVTIRQKANPLADEETLGTFSDGCFGDLSVLLNCTRTCTAVASEGGTIWRLKAKDYIAAVGGQSKAEMKRSQRESRGRSQSDDVALNKIAISKRARAGSHAPAPAQAVVEVYNKKHNTKKVTDVTLDDQGKAETIYKKGADNSCDIVCGTTIKGMLNMLLQYDDNFTRDVLLTFRDFMTDQELLQYLEKAYQTSGKEPHSLTPQRLKVLEVLSRWVCKNPLVDPTLRQHPQTIARMRKFVSSIPSCSSTRYILSALEPDEESPSKVTEEVEEEKTHSILVQFTALGACRTDLQIEMSSAETLAGLMNRVMDMINEQIQTSAGDTASESLVEAKTFEFRACDTGTVMHLAVCPAILKITQINCVPIDQSKSIANFMDPVLLAERLTILDHETFAKIRITELRLQLWTKHPNLCPNVVALTTRFNNVCCWIVNTILSIPKSKPRGQVIERIIELANELYFLDNFHGVVQVLSALNHPAVTRLKKTWTFVRQKSVSIFNCLNDIVNPQDNRSNYRDKLDSVIKAPLGSGPTKGLTTAVEPCLPYLGVFLSDIVFYEDGNPTKLPAYQIKGLNGPSSDDSDDVEMLNVSKFRGLGYLLSDILSYQQARFEFGSSSTLDSAYSLDCHLKEQDFPDDDAFYTKSFTLEEIGAFKPETNVEGEKALSMDGNSQMFRWRTIKHRAVAPANFGQAKAQNTGASIDGTLWYERFSKSPAMKYLGVSRVQFEEVETPGFAEKIRKTAERGKKTTKQVLIELKEKLKQILILNSGLERNVLLMRTFADIRYCGFQEDCKVLYFLTNSLDGDCEVYAFTSDNQQSQESYLLLYRILQRWTKTSANASQQGRAKAQERLMDPKNGNSDGAFVLRDSYSSPGNYALSVKYSKGSEPITHFLIERQANGEVKLKDSMLSFSSLPELILYYCQTLADMPVLLEPRGSEFLTPDCPRIAANLIKREERPEKMYYFGSLSRHEASVLLSRSQVMREGVFLLRNSSEEGSYALSFIQMKKEPQMTTTSSDTMEIVHVLIRQNKGYYHVDGKPIAQTMDEVIEKLSHGDNNVLPTILSKPCPAGYLTGGANFNSLQDSRLVLPTRFDTCVNRQGNANAFPSQPVPQLQPRTGSTSGKPPPYVGVQEFLDQVDTYEASMRFSQSSGTCVGYTDIFSVPDPMEALKNEKPMEDDIVEDDSEDDPLELEGDDDDDEPLELYEAEDEDPVDMPFSFASSGGLDLRRDSASTTAGSSISLGRRLNQETTI